jgi:hypothetical protein
MLRSAEARAYFRLSRFLLVTLLQNHPETG